MTAFAVFGDVNGYGAGPLLPIGNPLILIEVPYIKMEFGPSSEYGPGARFANCFSPARMNVYAVGAYGYGNFGDDCYTSILRARLAAVWADSKVDFHRVNPTPFSPDHHRAVVLGGGGTLCRYIGECGTDNLAYFLRYPAAMHCFGKGSYALGLGVQGAFKAAGMEPLLPTLNAMTLRTVRDTASARALRAAGVHSTVHQCADLSYLLPALPHQLRSEKPVLGIVASQPDKNVVYGETPGFEQQILRTVAELERDFAVRFISFAHHADGWLPSSIVYDPHRPGAIEKFIEEFGQIDICLTSRFHGIVLSVLHEIPFAAIGAPEEKLERECVALEHPLFLPYRSSASEFAAAVRLAWSERQALGMNLKAHRPRRVRLAERNIELLHSAEWKSREPRPAAPERDRDTLVIWAAADEFWEEARKSIDELGQVDCLVPAQSQVRPAGAKRRFALPQGALMHWSMMPGDLTRQIKGKYDNVVLCHASTRPAAPASR